MSKQLVTHLWCDHHEQAKQEQQEGAEHSVTIDGVQVDIELCPECFGPIEELLAWLREYGRVVKGTKRGPYKTRARQELAGEASTCPECGKALSSHRAVLQHMTRTHGTTLAAWLAQHDGQQGELPLVEAPAYVCEDCGRSFAKPQGLGRHRSWKHQATAAGAA